MDEYDAPRKMPVEHREQCPNLKEIEEQTCLLFEEFLNLDDAILDAPFSASSSRLAQNERSDSPVILQATRTRGFSSKSIEQKEAHEGSDDDDVVADSAPAIPTPALAASQAGPDDKMKLLARELQKAGDQFVTEYGPDVQDVESKLLQLVKQEAANLTYERFSMAVDDLVGKDKDWTTFVFAACVGRRICKHSQEACSYTKNFFQRYWASYSETIHERGGMEPFLRSRTHSTPQ